MQRNESAVWLLVALLPLVAWALWPTPVPEPVPSPEPVAVQSQDDEAGAEAEPAELATPAAGIQPEENQRQAVDTAAADNSLDQPLPHCDDEDALVVHLVSALDRQPLAGADLYQLDVEGAEPADLQWDLMSGDLGFAEVITKFSKHYRADQSGVVKLANPEGELVLYARFQDQVCFGADVELEPGQHEIWLELEAEVWVEVSVIDRGQNPQEGIPVDLVWSDEGFAFDVATQITDESGRAVFHDFNILQTTVMASEDGLLVALGIPLPEGSDPGMTRQPAVPTVAGVGDAIQLVLPETGSIVLKLVEANGDACTVDGFARLQDPTGQGQRITLSKSSAGEIRFPWIGLGLELTGFLRFDGSSQEQEFPIIGPVRSGEVIELEVTRVAWPSLSGRLLRPDGSPVLATRLDASVIEGTAGFDFPFGDSILTDSEGRFRLEIALDDLEEETPAVVYRLTLDGPDMIRLEAELAWDRSTDPDGAELGDVTMTAPPIFASGRILDEAGNGIGRAMITLNLEDGAGGDSFLEDSWELYAREHRYTNRNGDFILYGEAQEGNFRLEITADNFAGKIVPVLHGQTGMVIVLGGSADLSGRVLIDADLPADSIQVMVRQGRDRETVYLDGDDGDYQWLYQSATAESVSVSIETELGEVLMEGQDFNLFPGTVNAPPSLNPIDLRGLLHGYQVQVTDASGASLDATLSIAGEEGTEYVYGYQGELEFAARLPTLTVRVNAEGYRSLSLDLESGTSQVQLDQGIPVQLQFPPAFHVPEDASLYLMLSPVDGDGSRADSHFMEIESGDTMEITVSSGGDYRLIIIGLFMGNGDSHNSPQPLEHKVHVDDQPQMQTIHVPLTQEEIDLLLNGPPDH